MPKTSRAAPRREDSLSRERIVDAAIELLDGAGEAGLTFRALAERLATGPGALYWHVADKSDLLTAACDAVVARTLDARGAARSPKATIRALALGLFDAMDTHPWIGSALIQAPGQLPMVRILEGLGRPLQALGVPAAAQWPAVSTLLHYILGVGGQNAANSQVAQARGAERASFMAAVAAQWAALDAHAFAFTRAMAGALRDHDDRADFLAGLDFILAGLDGARAR